MATTTNYGWTTPDDTALVKDGAAAIRTLGSSVDTTTKALNPSTTLGDIEYRSSTANTNTRLGIGTTGQVLSVSGGVPAWSTLTVSSALTVVKAKTSFSNVANTGTTFDSVFSATYDNYLIIIDRVFAATSTDDLLFTYLYSGTEQATGYYGNMLRLRYDDTTTTGTIFNRNAATSLILNDMTGDTFYDTRASINVYTGNAIGMSGHGVAGASNLGYMTFGGVNETSRTYTGFRLKSSSSNITGSCTVYGLAKS
jgi:hypothetical protein